MPQEDLMSWTRLDDDRTIPAATGPRIKACFGGSGYATLQPRGMSLSAVRSDSSESV